MSLGGNKPGMFWKLDHLNNSSVRRFAGKLHAVTGKGCPEIIVDLIAVAVALMDQLLTVKRVGF